MKKGRIHIPGQNRNDAAIMQQFAAGSVAAAIQGGQPVPFIDVSQPNILGPMAPAQREDGPHNTMRRWIW